MLSQKRCWRPAPAHHESRKTPGGFPVRMFQDCLNGPERNMISIHHECPGITDGGPIMAISQWRDRPDYQVALKRRSVPSGKRYYQGTDSGCCDREEKKCVAQFVLMLWRAFRSRSRWIHEPYGCFTKGIATAVV